MQATLKSSVTFEGVGLHAGQTAKMVVRPALAGSGITFRRMDILGEAGRLPARWDMVEVSPLNTRLRNTHGTTISTIEHVMAALAGCGIHNAFIELNGPEVPIMDGSAAAFVRGFVDAGVVHFDAPMRAIEILDTVTVEEGDAFATLSPATSLQIAFDIAFPDAAIGTQRKTLNMANGAFVRELCDSRTFCRASDVDTMRANGLALGGTMENAVVVDGDQVLSPGGLRHADEAVRHKMLDALGDLYTAGAPILGRYTGHKAGHALTNKLLRALFAQPKAWRWVNVDHTIAARLPGVGVSHADLDAVA
ncbi:UDP-3-O-acyl-N-acetylglucosamine deacetylase [Rhodobacteraceae bacterium S2214]|nr:UDP-3-O-acyl-N-acetylglucosamine deacetylase [Rhodobacteraceae bacterium S2214]